MTGRAELGKYGPNHAADCTVTRDHLGQTEVLLVEKQVGDGESCLAFPAGMVEAGQTVPATLRKELLEEAAEDSPIVDRLFSDECYQGSVYAGHVDDWRNTDWVWMETHAVHYHATPEVAQGLTLGVKETTEI